jgi:chromate transporter
MRARDLIYLKDVFVVAVTTFGGPQTHLPIMLNQLVKKRKYFTEDELLEVNALCMMLPGPSSTQTIIALSQRKGGVVLAILALLVWIIPACAAMTAVAMLFSTFELRNMPTDFLQFVQPMAIGIVAFAGYSLSKNVIKKPTGWMIAAVACAIAVITTSPWTFPSVIVGAAIVTNFTNKQKTLVGKNETPIQWDHSWLSL